MREHDAFWERVQAVLDERREPLEDPEVLRGLAALAAHDGPGPDAGQALRAELARLVTRLEALECAESIPPLAPGPPLAPAHLRAGRRFLAGLASAAAALALFFALRAGPGPVPELVPRADVLSFRVEVRVSGPGGERCRVVQAREGVLDETEHWAARPGTDFAGGRLAMTTTSNHWSPTR